LPIPYDSTTSYRSGTRDGPAAIIAASQQMELFDEELGAEFHHAGIATLSPIEQVVSSPEAMQEAVFNAARRVVDDGKFLFGLGGEHSVSCALVRAVQAKHPRVSVLQIDAHCDLRDRYQGSPYSHACVMRRIYELGVPIVPVGIRSVSLEEHRFIEKASIFPITAYHCHTENGWVDEVVDRLGEDVYVTIDIDGFDPAYAPGTGTPEPGGLDWFQVTGLLRSLAATRRIVAADIVEVLPIAGQTVTEFMAARLAYKLMSYVQNSECRITNNE